MAIWKKPTDKNYSSLGIDKGKPLTTAKHQTGRTTKRIDEKRTALPPGKRISKYGKVYYEYRKNRSDMLDELI